MKILININPVITAVALLAISCNKLVDAGNPYTMLQTSIVFSDRETALSAVAGFYQGMVMNSKWIANGGVTLYAGLSADELRNVYPSEEMDRFHTNSLMEDDDLGIYGNLWQAAYKNIYQANLTLEGIENSSSLERDFSNQIKGEMLLGRALNYFYLINLFGDVPLALHSSYEENQSMPRTPEKDIYTQIIQDIRLASELMSATYSSEGRVRPNKFAALGLLARIYLYQKEWQKAYDTANDVIEETSLYQLASMPADVFLPNSDEAIWQIQPISGGFMNTGEGFIFNPYNELDGPPYTITETLLEAFSSGDRRKEWIGINTATGKTLYYPRKYKVKVSSDITEHYFVLRLAEIYLIRAEASVRLENLGAAQSDVNIIRARAGLMPISVSDKESMLQLILDERRTELFCEWGNRWLDLKRTNLADKVLADYKSPNWQSTDVLYPIPKRERLLNPFLSQNPGY